MNLNLINLDIIEMDGTLDLDETKVQGHKITLNSNEILEVAIVTANLTIIIDNI